MYDDLKPIWANHYEFCDHIRGKGSMTLAEYLELCDAVDDHNESASEYNAENAWQGDTLQKIPYIEIGAWLKVHDVGLPTVADYEAYYVPLPPDDIPF